MSSSGDRDPSLISFPSIVVAVGSPAAGADWLFTLPAARTLIAVRAHFVASAAVANRVPVLNLSDNAAHVAASLPIAGALAATAQPNIVWALGCPYQSVNGGAILCPLPALPLGVGSTVAVSTQGLDVADQWSAIVLTFAG